MRGRQGVSKASCADFEAGVVAGVAGAFCTERKRPWIIACAVPTSATKAALIGQRRYDSASRAAGML
jgi:hypothetical protein